MMTLELRVKTLQITVVVFERADALALRFIESNPA